MQELLRAYALSIITNDFQACRKATQALEDQGYSFAGYIGAPALYQGTEIVARLTFHYTKNNTYAKRNPYTITIGN